MVSPLGVSGNNRRSGRGKYDRSKSYRERREERQKRLIRAASHVFAAKGRAGATVADIVEAAGVSRQTFYEHFDNLLDCLIQVYDHSINATFWDAERTLRAVDDPVERLRSGIVGYLAGMGRNPALTLVLHRGSLAAGPEYLARREAAYSRWVALMMEGVAEAYAKGIVSRPPDELTAYVLISGMETLALRYLDRGDADRITDAAPSLVELTLRAFGGDPAKILRPRPERKG
jgi:AcrR family transcriptional regulator